MPPQLNLPLSKPTFNWDATNLHEAFKGFKQQCDNLLGGPYSDHSGEAKVSAILNWLGIKSYSIFDTLDLTKEQKKDYKEVLATVSGILQTVAISATVMVPVRRTL